MNNDTLKVAKKLFELSLIEIQNKNFSQAETLLKQARDLAPQRISIHRNLTAVLAAQKKYNETFTTAIATLELNVLEDDGWQGILISLQESNEKLKTLTRNIVRILEAKHAGTSHPYNHEIQDVKCQDKQYVIFQLAYFLATVFEKLGDYQRATEIYVSLTTNLPEFEASWIRLISLCLLAHQSSEALNLCTIALKTHPNSTNIRQINAELERRNKNLKQALLHAKIAINLNPNDAQAHTIIAHIYADTNDADSAISHYLKARELAPRDFRYQTNLGVAYRQAGNPLAARECLLAAITLNSKAAEPYYNLGKVEEDLDNLQTAIIYYSNALELNPNYAEAKWNKSLALLKIGEFLKGWELYNSRWSVPNRSNNLKNYGTPTLEQFAQIKGSKIFVYAEQGLGDSIQFCRYLELLVADQAAVFLDVPESLRDLFTANFPDVLITDEKFDLKQIDFICPLLDLPKIYATSLKNIPYRTGYLSCGGKRAKSWLKVIPNTGKKRIGFVTRGSKGGLYQEDRSVPITIFEKVFSDKFDFYCLAKDIADYEKKIFEKHNILFFDEQLKDFSDTAALIDTMDLVISIDTSVAHLSGAMGKKTWILLIHNSDWRWLTDRTDSVWYESVELFRQSKKGDWTGVIDQISNRLSKEEKLSELPLFP